MWQALHPQEAPFKGHCSQDLVASCRGLHSFFTPPCSRKVYTVYQAVDQAVGFGASFSRYRCIHSHRNRPPCILVAANKLVKQRPPIAKTISQPATSPTGRRKEARGQLERSSLRAWSTDSSGSMMKPVSLTNPLLGSTPFGNSTSKGSLVRGATLLFDVLADDNLETGKRQEMLDKALQRVRATGAATGIQAAALTMQAPQPQTEDITTLEVVGIAHESEVTDDTAALDADRAALAEQLVHFTPEVILQELLGDLFVHPRALEMGKMLGQGAFATVHQAMWTPESWSGQVSKYAGPSLQVAVKSLKPSVLASGSDLKDFLLEVNVLRKMKHPNVVSFLGIGAMDLTELATARESMFVIMEVLAGGTLRHMVTQQMTSTSPVYQARDALRWATDLASAMHYLHGVCRPMIVHRDLKLDNVMLTDDPIGKRTAKLADFGLHKRARASVATPAPPTKVQVTTGRHIDEDMSYYGGNAWASVHGGAGNALNGSKHGSKNNSMHGASEAPGMRASRSVEADLNAMVRSTSKGALIDGVYAPTSLDATKPPTLKQLVEAAAAAAATDPGAPRAMFRAMSRNTLLGMDNLGTYDSSTGPSEGPTQHGGGTALSALGPGGSSLQSVQRGGVSALGALQLAASKLASEQTASVQLASEQRQSKEHSRPSMLSPAAVDETFSFATQSNGIQGRGDSCSGLSSNSSSAHSPAHALPTRPTSTGISNPPPAPVASSSQTTGLGSDKISNSSLYAPANPCGTMAAPSLVANGTVGGEGVRASLVEGRPSMAAQLSMGGEALQAAAAAAPQYGLPTGMATLMSDPEQLKTLQSLGELLGDRCPWPGPSDRCPWPNQKSTDRCPYPGPKPITLLADRAWPRGRENGSTDSLQHPGSSQHGPGQGPDDASVHRKMLALMALDRGGHVVTEERSVRAGIAGLRGSEEVSQRAGSAGLRGSEERSVRGGSAGGSFIPEEVSVNPVFLAPLADAKRVPAGQSSLTITRPGQGMKAIPENARASIDTVALSEAHNTVSAPPVLPRVGELGSGKGAAGAFIEATQAVGSLMYMAPEVINGHSYGHKVDVFSFGMMMYELFCGKLIACRWEFTEGAEDAVTAYVDERSKGMRERIPVRWPEGLRSLIADCWHQDPLQRPEFQEVKARLEALHGDATISSMQAKPGGGASSGSCCLIS